MPSILVDAATAAVLAAVVGVIGVSLLRITRARSVATVLHGLVGVTVLSVVVGVVGAAQAMLVNRHDLQVVLVVTVAAGVVSVAVAVAVGRQLVADSRVVQELARTLAHGERLTAPSGYVTSELAALGQELAATSVRLAEARDREAALESSRRELVAWVSHDIRTPLAGLRAMAEALEDRVVDDPERYHRQIRVEVDRLTHLVNDLFELSRIQAGALHLAPERVAMSDLVSEALLGMDPLAHRRGIRLIGPAVSGLPVWADSRELSRALSNLMINAIQHTPPEGTVTVDLGERAGAVVLSVSDGCGGIPDADLTRLFDVAWRGTDARSPGPDSGAGLGLAIVRGIVQAHSGEVTVANHSNGCRFEVTLPLV
jgi:signal transduction histidine kinase